jgi:hypothetical protein
MEGSVMLEITLTADQAKIVASALKPVLVRDERGNVLGRIQPVWTEQDIAEAKRALASDQPRYTTQQVLAHLRSLEGG